MSNEKQLKCIHSATEAKNTVERELCQTASGGKGSTGLSSSQCLKDPIFGAALHVIRCVLVAAV